MEFLDSSIAQWVIGIVAGAFTMWVIPNRIWGIVISFFGATLAPILDKVAMGADAAGVIAEGAGLEKVGAVLHAASDVVDEIEDIPRLLAEWTKDGVLDADEIKKIITETGEIGVEFKNLILVVKKKDAE